MAVFAAQAGNKSQPLNEDYVDAANMVNVMCGPGFVNASVPNAGSGKGGGTKSSAAAASRAGGLGYAGWVGLVVGMAVGLGAGV